MSQDVGQRLKIKIQCLKIKTKKGLLMVWWRPLPSPAPAWAGGAPAQPSQPAWRPALRWRPLPNPTQAQPGPALQPAIGPPLQPKGPQGERGNPALRDVTVFSIRRK